MAAKNGQKLGGDVSSKDMTVEEFSNIFASEFNNSEIHDRVLCFQIIKDEEFGTKDDESQSENENKDMEETENTIAACETSKLKDDGEKSNVVGEEEKLQCPAKFQGSKTSEMADHENKSIASKLFVHSQWLAVQSPYFKALFYSGMKETYSKEVVMKIYEDELQAHLTLIEAMYKLDVLNDKDYRLLVQVLVLANKYDVRLVIKKCKYVLLSTPPSLEMCDYCLREMEHLSDMADIYDMLEKFLVNEFTPIEETWTMQKFTELSEAALRLLLRSDNLGSRSENTVFVALMKWVKSNLSFRVRYIQYVIC